MSLLLKSVVLIAVVFLALVVLSSRISGGEPTILGYQIKSVLSGSMEPTFQTGSLIAIELDNATYKKGDIITFHMDEKLITHRITDVKQANGQVSYKTKGDNNDGPDLWTVSSQDVVGKYTNVTIPYVGYAMTYANTKAGMALLLIVPGLLLIISALRVIVGAVKEVEVKNAV
ncbi:signal peptidase I SipW [Sporosarcina sp. NPDC096371]|uniref:signal peptidase I SipW n=1 Tax=Sporosarcina sp. NPDC096371 TaxID=3364530 RepID=UPI00382BE2A1